MAVRESDYLEKSQNLDWSGSSDPKDVMVRRARILGLVNQLLVRKSVITQ